MTDTADNEALDSLIGHKFSAWARGEDGIGTHFTLDDGRIIIVIGYVAIWYPNVAVH